MLLCVKKDLIIINDTQYVFINGCIGIRDIFNRG